MPPRRRFARFGLLLAAWLLGAPAIPEREFKLITAAMSRLPEMRRTLKRIAKHLGLDGTEA